MNLQDVFYVEHLDQAMTLLQPLRMELLRQMAMPRTCPELAAMFSESAQKIYYHVKALEKVGLVEKTAEKRVRGIMEGYYLAKARAYWLSPHLVGQVGGEQTARDQTSLRFLLNLAEEVQDDIGRLGHKSEVGESVPSLGMSAYVYLPDGTRRGEFLKDVQRMFEELAHRYSVPRDYLPDRPEGNPEGKSVGNTASIPGATFRLIMACYPKNQPPEETDS